MHMSTGYLSLHTHVQINSIINMYRTILKNLIGSYRSYYSEEEHIK